ncbi:PaaI family thioesterase [Paenibacillus segetis]|uniref:Esterase n=1 Tax=Paenibacillus segetis TaxID=1325360 RepID=A0ABQ1YA37_9BACL|nr:PaaI family thioesterase [Paenibacillus segetis]GGH18166.1 esterase [Paenibacillus segetis]
MDIDWTEITSRNEKTFWGLLGLRMLSVDSSHVKLALTVNESHLNSMGIVHGGVLSSMMDQAMGTLVTANKNGQQAVTTNLNVTFLNAMRSGDLVVSAYPMHESQRSMTLRAEVHGEDGTLACIATATFLVPRDSKS